MKPILAPQQIKTISGGGMESRNFFALPKKQAGNFLKNRGFRSGTIYAVNVKWLEDQRVSRTLAMELIFPKHKESITEAET
jgi:hypothetical protein